MATQEQIAEHLDLSKRRVQDLMAEGVLGKGADLDQCRINYIRYLRSNASGQHTGATPTLADGRARLVKLQADKVEIELAELRGEVVRADVEHGRAGRRETLQELSCPTMLAGAQAYEEIFWLGRLVPSRPEVGVIGAEED
jgi:hypothetical protein